MARRKKEEKLPTYDEVLLEHGLVTREQLEIGQSVSRDTWDVLVKLGFITHDQHRMAIAKSVGYTWMNDLPSEIPKDVLARVTPAIAHEWGILPLAFDPNYRGGEHAFGGGRYNPGRLTIAYPFPTAYELVSDIDLVLNLPIDPHIAPESKIRRAIEEHYGPAPTLARRSFDTGDFCLSPSARAS